MGDIEYKKSKQLELTRVAHDMINGKMHLIEGVRKICSLRHAVDDPDNDVFMPIEAIDSETDHFPLGEMRSHCALEYLKRADAETERYLDDARKDILKACEEIIHVFS